MGMTHDEFQYEVYHILSETLYAESDDYSGLWVEGRSEAARQIALLFEEEKSQWDK